MRRKILVSLVMLVCGLLSIYMIVSLCILCSLPNPQEYREAAIVLTTRQILAGQNPFALNVQPQFCNCYGIAFNVVVYPFAKMFGATFQTHRVISSLCLLGIVVSMYAMMRWRKVPAWLAFVSAVFLLRELGGGIGAMARPDNLGLLLFLWCLIVPWRFGYSYRNLGVSIVLSALALITKPYFLLGLPILALYLFLFQDKKKGIATGVAGAAVLLATVALMNRLFPTYIDNIFTVNSVEASYSIRHLALQSAFFTLQHMGLFVIVLYALLASARGPRLEQTAAPKGLDIRHWSKPLLAWNWDLMSVALLVGTAVVVLKMGGHVGSTMTYFNQLISPFLMFVAFAMAAALLGRSQRDGALVIALILLNAGLMWIRVKPLPSTSPDDWASMKQMVSADSSVYGDSLIADMLYQQGKPVFDNGQSGYLTIAVAARPQAFSPALVRQCAAVEDDVLSRVEQRKFDLILKIDGKAPYFSQEVLEQNYRLAGTRWLPMVYPDGGHTLQIWRPLP